MVRLRAALLILLFFVACATLLAAVGPFDRIIPGLPAGLLTGVVTSVGTLLLTVVFVRWEKMRLADVGAAIGKQSVSRFAVGFGLGLLLVAMHVSIEAIVGRVRWIRSESVGPGTIAMMLATYILLACREELAFRGYPLRRLNSVYGLWISQIVVSIVFALEHVAGGSSWMQAFLGAGIGSLLFGMAALATRGLAVPIGLHAAWNFGDWLHGGKGSGSLWRPIISDAYQNSADRAAMAGYIIIMIVATVAFWIRTPQESR